MDVANISVELEVNKNVSWLRIGYDGRYLSQTLRSFIEITHYFVTRWKYAAL